MANKNPMVTLLTDFGLRDHFVATMKGVMLGINPDLRFTDISHLVPPQDVFSGTACQDVTRVAIFSRS